MPAQPFYCYFTAILDFSRLITAIVTLKTKKAICRVEEIN